MNVKTNIKGEIIILKAIFFDLFFTLIYPRYSQEDNEFDILNITMEEWEQCAENPVLYEKRALGKVNSEDEIIDKILNLFPNKIDKEQRDRLLHSRLNRMRMALENSDDEIIYTLEELKKHKIKLCLISNADVIDCKYWKTSILSTYFDEAIFSCEVGLLKPNAKIYTLAMERMGVIASESLFVGDGGSNELFGAKQAKMRTVLTEYLERKEENQRKIILQNADIRIDSFKDLLLYID